MNLLLAACLLAAGVCMLPFSPASLAQADTPATPDRPVHVVIIGDSTAASYAAGNERQLAGWGQVLQEVIGSPHVKVTNLAISGRSSRNFIRENNWQTFMTMDPPPDYLLIQFGHNDSGSLDQDKDPRVRRTLPDVIPDPLPAQGPGSSLDHYFRHWMARYITLARSRGVTPLIVTPMERSRFDEAGQFVPTTKRYALPAMEVAQATSVPVLDLNTYSAQRYQAWGREGSVPFHAKTDKGGFDATHFNRQGAWVWAAYIARALHDKAPALRPWIDPARITDAPPEAPADNEQAK